MIIFWGEINCKYLEVFIEKFVIYDIKYTRVIINKRK